MSLRKILLTLGLILGILAPVSAGGLWNGLFIDKACWPDCVGRLVCDDYCKKSRVENCRLTTDPDNLGAIRFYKIFGFQLDCELRDYYELGDRKMMMVKRYDRS